MLRDLGTNVGSIAGVPDLVVAVGTDGISRLVPGVPSADEPHLAVVDKGARAVPGREGGMCSHREPDIIIASLGVIHLYRSFPSSIRLLALGRLGG